MVCIRRTHTMDNGYGGRVMMGSATHMASSNNSHPNCSQKPVRVAALGAKPTSVNMIGGQRTHRQSTANPSSPLMECGWTGVPVVTNSRASRATQCNNIRMQSPSDNNTWTAPCVCGVMTYTGRGDMMQWMHECLRHATRITPLPLHPIDAGGRM